MGRATSHARRAGRCNDVVSLPPFQSLLDAHGREVHRLLVAIVGRDEADDCYQETWIAALRAYPRLRSTENLHGWVLTIARRKALDALRRRGRALAIGIPPVGPLPVGPLPETLSATSAETLPETVLDRPELADGGPLAAVQGLPDKQRAAVGMRFLLDADYRSIAAAMSTSEAAARRNVHEGLKKLRQEYER